jgi:arylsulfatase A-like enzyme
VPRLKRLGYHVASFGKVAHGRDRFDGCDFHSPRPRDLARNVHAYLKENEIDKPLCLWVGDRRPHVPWIKESTYDPAAVTLPAGLVDTPQTRAHWARYLTDITGMDNELGRVYADVREMLGDDFIFLFTSDHGGQWPFGKWNLYDAGTRVPLIVVWRGHVEAGVRTDAMVSWVDILPTLIDLVGGTVPADIDGRSFAAVLRGTATSHRQKIFTTHTGDGRMNIFPIRSVRVGRFKFIHNLRPNAYHTNHSDRLRNDGAGAYWDSWDAAALTDPRAAAIVRRYYTRPEYELFDLQRDPLEHRNLADTPRYRATREALRAELQAWTTAQGDDLLPHREPYFSSQPLPDLRPPSRD